MFLSHFAVAMAAKKAVPRVSLGTLVMSAQFLDLVWPILLLVGLEHVRIDPGNTVFTPLAFESYPISHSLLAVVGWSLAFGTAYYAIRRSATAAWLLAACVLSHWVLDAVVHRPDLPLHPGSAALIGFGLWNSFAATVVAESAIFLLGVLVYVHSTRAADRTGRFSFWAFVVFLAIIWIGNSFGPPPPGETAIGVVGMLQWLFIPWAYWIDRHRTPVVNH